MCGTCATQWVHNLGVNEQVTFCCYYCFFLSAFSRNVLPRVTAHSVDFVPLVSSCQCTRCYGTIPNLPKLRWRVHLKVMGCLQILLIYNFFEKRHGYRGKSRIVGWEGKLSANAWREATSNASQVRHHLYVYNIHTMYGGQENAFCVYGCFYPPRISKRFIHLSI